MDHDELRLKAERGSTVAQGILGFDYLFGDRGVAQDYAEAFRWLTAAAGKGAPRPAVWLGTMYEQGLGIAADAAKARDLYEFGAERGEPFGCVYLARLLLSGRLGAIDEAGALRRYRAVVEMPNISECAELEEARAFVRAHG